MKVSFEGTVEEFREVFLVGMALSFEDTEEEVVEDLSFNLSPKEVEVEEKKPRPVFVQDVPDQPPIGKEAIPFPQNKPFSGSMKELTTKERAGCVEEATKMLESWVEGFDTPEAEQPDRVKLIEKMGSSQWTVPFLVLCYEYGSLQKFCGTCLRQNHREKFDSEEAWWEWIDSVACNIVQVSVAGFPDVQGTYDYSTRWKREALGEA